MGPSEVALIVNGWSARTPFRRWIEPKLHRNLHLSCQFKPHSTITITTGCHNTLTWIGKVIHIPCPCNVSACKSNFFTAPSLLPVQSYHKCCGWNSSMSSSRSTADWHEVIQWSLLDPEVNVVSFSNVILRLSETAKLFHKVWREIGAMKGFFEIE